MVTDAEAEARPWQGLLQLRLDSKGIKSLGGHTPLSPQLLPVFGFGTVSLGFWPGLFGGLLWCLGELLSGQDRYGRITFAFDGSRRCGIEDSADIHC